MDKLATDKATDKKVKKVKKNKREKRRSEKQSDERRRRNRNRKNRLEDARRQEPVVDRKLDDRHDRDRDRSREARQGKATATHAEPSATTSRGWAALTELLGRRAGIRVLWELRAGPAKFRELQAACDGLSPSTLNQRLAELRDARLVEIEERQGYRLTPQGEELVERFEPLAGWAESWSHRRAQKRRSDGPPRKRAAKRVTRRATGQAKGKGRRG